MALFGRKKEPEKKPDAQAAAELNDPLAAIPEEEYAARTGQSHGESRSPSMEQVRKFDSLQPPSARSSTTVPKPVSRTSVSSANIPLPGGRSVSNSVIPKGEEATSIRRSGTGIQTGGLQSEEFVDTLAESLGMGRVDLNKLDVTKDLIDQIPKKVAKDYKVFPVEYDEYTISVAISDPSNIQAIDDLERILRKKVEALVAKEDDIDRFYKRYYEGNEISDMYQRVSTELRTDLDFMGDDATTIDVGDEGGDTPPVVKFVDLIFRQAVHDRASDIHIEPTRYGVTIRFRIDGVCHEVPSPPKKWQNAIISRLKVMSGMDLAEKRIPQDGRIKLNLGQKKLDLRVSVLPAIYGESIVMRILDQSATMKGLADVGFLPDNIEKFERLIQTPTGVILMTGPTGSGKTTTLYAALSTLNNPETKIITIENPVEYMIEGINQVQVNEEVGLDFTRGLRSMLRQSPDVILVGEIRDFETAEIGIRAALTGHLVFSTRTTRQAPPRV
jgi:type IV pilus assembly protein PilB